MKNSKNEKNSRIRLVKLICSLAGLETSSNSNYFTKNQLKNLVLTLTEQKEEIELLRDMVKDYMFIEGLEEKEKMNGGDRERPPEFKDF